MTSCTSPPLIGTGNLKQGCLSGQVAVVTGAGRGIGFEAARALVWLGARVAIAEINPLTGKSAADSINSEFGPPGKACFIRTDVGNARDVRRLAKKLAGTWGGRVDIVLNNATLALVGPIHDTPIRDWDLSYRVNMRGPVLLAQAFLPGMLARHSGTFVCVSSSPGPFMGPYETMKSAQAELANIAAGETENSGVHIFAIGPGIVRTPALAAAMPKLAKLYGKTVDEFFAMSAAHELSPEAAGAGFAAAIALAPRFHGQVLGSKQALHIAGIDLPESEKGQSTVTSPPPALEVMEQAAGLCHEVRATLEEQSQGWQERSMFERQWVVRDFRKEAGMPAEQWLEALARLQDLLSGGDWQGAINLRVPLQQLAHYYQHLAKLAEGYEKDPETRRKSMGIVLNWRKSVLLLEALFNGTAKPWNNLPDHS